MDARLSQTSELWDHHYGYGVRRLELSADAIANYQFQVNVCHARMKDGTLVAIDPGQELDRLDLKEAFARDPVVKVYLAVPKLKIGAQNVRSDGQTAKSRYVEIVQSVQDESTGGNDQELRFRMLDVRLLLSTQDMAGYEVLPLAQIQRATEKEAAPAIDDSYFPPMLAIDAWPPLGRDVVRDIYDIVGKKIEVLSEQVVNRGITLVSQEPGDLERLFMLNELNAAYSVLNVHGFRRGNPSGRRLRRIVPPGGTALAVRQGAAAARHPTLRPRRPGHDLPQDQGLDRVPVEPNPGLRIRAAVLRGRNQGHGRDAGVEVAGQRLAMVRRRAPRQPQRAGLPGLAAARCFEREARQFAAGRFALSILAPKGLQLRPLSQAPRALPPRRDWLYFEVSRDNAAWRDVLETQTLAMRLTENLIVNRDKLQGERNIVVSVGGKHVNLQFALFAVPLPRTQK